MPMVPVNAAPITAVDPVAHGAVPLDLSAAVYSKIVCCSKYDDV